MTKPRNEVATVAYALIGGQPQREPFPEAERIVWTFADKEVVEVMVDDIPDGFLRCAALFGIKTKLRNAYCDAQTLVGAKDGLARALANARAGAWNVGPEAREHELVALLPQAIADVLQISLEAASRKIARKEGEDKKPYYARLRKIAEHRPFAVRLAEIRSERVKAPAEADLESYFTAESATKPTSQP